jgi:hypothetical protein
MVAVSSAAGTIPPDRSSFTSYRNYSTKYSKTSSATGTVFTD